ncbi:MAG: hypothetical protein Rhob2KO_07180 [Rhodopirellula baltica]
MVAGGCCVAAYPRKTSPRKTFHPAVAKGHGGMESGGVGGVSIGGAIAYRRLPSDIPTGMKTSAKHGRDKPKQFAAQREPRLHEGTVANAKRLTYSMALTEAFSLSE